MLALVYGMRVVARCIVDRAEYFREEYQGPKWREFTRNNSVTILENRRREEEKMSRGEE